MPNKVSYSAIVLTTQSKIKLMTQMKMMIDIPGDWSIVCDHMTLCLGPMPWEANWAEDVSLTIDAIGYGDGVIAVRVSSHVRLDLGTPHITVAYDINKGIRPKDAAKITNWVPLEDKINLHGEVKQVYQQPVIKG